MKRDIGPHGLDLVKGFESFVPYVYDDLVPMQTYSDGHRRYPEWDGGHVRGTLTIGYGHTDAARDPLKIAQGLKVTEKEALDILHNDLGECVEQVNAAATVPLTQGQFDALTSFTFNCGAGNLHRLCVPLNRGDYDRTRGDFGHYVRSKGQVLAGLERRRHAEQVLWDDRYEELANHAPDETTASSVEPDARPELVKQHVTPTAIAVGTAGAAEAAHTINDALSNVKQVHETAADMLSAIVGQPMLWIAIVGIAGVAFLWWQHRNAGTQ
jgi:lysozyme